MWSPRWAGCLLLVLFQGSQANLPSELKACSRSSKDYLKCFENEILKGIHFFKNGSKKFGVRSLDPLVFDRIVIDQGTGSVSIYLEFAPFTLHGISTVRAREVRNDGTYMVFNGYLEELRVTANYTINGKILVLPVQGKGPCEIILRKMDTDFKVKFHTINKKGKDYYEVSNFQTVLNPRNATFRLDNLFNGDKALGDNMNRFMNENWFEILNELRPGISKALSIGFTQITNKIMSHIPKEQIDIK